MNILFLLSRVPYPLEKGDKLRAFHHLKLLAESHSVTLVALTDEPVHPDAEAMLRPLCNELHVVKLSWFSRLINMAVALVNGMPLSTGYFYSSVARRVIDDVIARKHPLRVYCQLTRMSEYVRHRTSIPRILDFQDAFSKGMERRAEREPWMVRWIFHMERRRLAKYEARMLDEFDNCIIISAQDRDCIAHPARHQIVVVPNGVDFDSFRARQADKDYDLVFAGNMAYPPNIESVEFLVERILPIVWKSRPEVRLLVAGATPAKRIRDLACERVHVSGWVDDISESYARARIFVAPMLISTGLQNKLLEAMAMKLPCVTSELANNALGGTHGENVLICSQPVEYGATIVRLLEDSSFASSVAAAGCQFVHERYSWSSMTRPLLDLLEKRERRVTT